MALRDTLLAQQQRAEEEQQAIEERPKVIEEWQAAIKALFADLRGWFAEHEEKGLVTYSERDASKTEESLGTYLISVLTIHAGSVAITVDPMGRRTAGARGRVEMRGSPPHVDRVVTLLRGAPPAGSDVTWVIDDRWVIDIPPKPNSRPHLPVRGGTHQRVFQPLTKETFEDALHAILT